MIGTGIKDDPYIVRTWEEFITAVGTESAYVKLDGDIDMNGTEYSRNFSPAELKCADINGGGHTIRNIYCLNPTETVRIFDVCTILSMENIRFENIALTGNRTEIFHGAAENCGVALANCIFAGKMFEGGYLNVNTDKDCVIAGSGCYVNMMLCTVALDLTLQMSRPIFSSFVTVRSSQIKLNLICLAYRGTLVAYNAAFVETTISNSYLFATIEQKGDVKNFILAEKGKFDSFYFVAEFRNILNVSWNAPIGAVCFFDKEVIGDTPLVIKNDYAHLILGLTTEQCKDAEYLKSIGYACEEGE